MNPFLLVAIVASALYAVDNYLTSRHANSNDDRSDEDASVSQRPNGRRAVDNRNQQRERAEQHNRQRRLEAADKPADNPTDNDSDSDSAAAATDNAKDTDKKEADNV